MSKAPGLIRAFTAATATLALAATFTVAPSILGTGAGIGLVDDAAYANNGKGKGAGNKGNKGGNKGAGKKGGKSDKDRGKSDKARSGKKSKGAKSGKGGGIESALTRLFNPNQAKKGQRAASAGTRHATHAKSAKGAAATKYAGPPTKYAPETSKLPKAKAKKPMLASADAAALHPSEKGRWNASPAQAAIDAHIRNQKWNSTVGMLAAYDLTARAVTDFESLTEVERAALGTLLPEGTKLVPVDLGGDTLLYTVNETIGDDSKAGFDIVEIEDLETGRTIYEVTCADGASCTEDEIAAAQSALDDYVAGEEEKADLNRAALEDAYEGAKDTILENSNKGPYDAETEDRLFDDIATNMGVTRPETLPGYGENLVLAPEPDDMAMADDALLPEGAEITVTE